MNNLLYKQHVIVRIVVAIIMFCCVMWGYWWLTWCLAIGLLFYFPNYFEIILLGIFYDGLYGVAIPEFWGIKYLFTILSIFLFLFTFFLKKRLIIYDDEI